MRQEFIVAIDSEIQAGDTDVRHVLRALTGDSHIRNEVTHIEVRHMLTGEVMARSLDVMKQTCPVCGNLPCDHEFLRQDLRWLKRDNAELLRMLAEPPELATGLAAARDELQKQRHPLAKELPDPEEVLAKERAMKVRAGVLTIETEGSVGIAANGAEHV